MVLKVSSIVNPKASNSFAGFGLVNIISKTLQAEAWATETIITAILNKANKIERKERMIRKNLMQQLRP